MLVRDAIAECKLSNSVIEAREARKRSICSRRRPARRMPRPGLIYLDIEMPGMDGKRNAQAHFKSDPELRDIPVVMMTGVSDDAQMRTAPPKGPTAYTIKTGKCEQFLRTVAGPATNYWLTIHQYPHRARGACAADKSHDLLRQSRRVSMRNCDRGCRSRRCIGMLSGGRNDRRSRQRESTKVNRAWIPEAAGD